MAFKVVIAAPPPPPATGTSFQPYPCLATASLITFSAAASPPAVHQCSICTCLLSSPQAPPVTPTMPGAAPPPINNALILISLLFPVFPPAENGPAPDPETVDRLPIIKVSASAMLID